MPPPCAGMAIPCAANQESNWGSVKRITAHRAHLWNLPPAWKFTPPSCRNAIPASTIVQMTPEQINLLIEAMEDPHDLCLMCIGLFCATRTSETFGLQWKSYGGDSLMIHSTAYEGELYRGQVKTGASRNAVPIPDDIVPIIEAGGRDMRPNTSPDALMCSRRMVRRAVPGSTVPRRAKSFLKWRIHPIAKKMNIPSRLVTFQVMRRNLGHRPAATWNHQRCARSLTPRQHQDDG